MKKNHYKFIKTVIFKFSMLSLNINLLKVNMNPNKQMEKKNIYKTI